MQKHMVNKKEVQEALRRSQELDSRLEMNNRKTIKTQDSAISLLIHDIFGGEILKTHIKNGWHFYNRIDGERVDFSKSESTNSVEDNGFDDLPANIDEPSKYFDMEEYSAFYSRFINAFEETIGLDKYKLSYMD